jgi:predicted adenine nucleotide alpha hydrolase (AANH) superfamily ATPase
LPFLRNFGNRIQGFEKYRKSPKKTFEKFKLDFESFRKPLKQGADAVFGTALAFSKRENTNQIFPSFTKRNEKRKPKQKAARPFVVAKLQKRSSSLDSVIG